MNLNFWNSSISLNEGTTELILENNSLRHSSNLGHFKMKYSLFHWKFDVSTPFNIQVDLPDDFRKNSNFNQFKNILKSWNGNV